MLIEHTKFVIMTKSRPTEFMTATGETTENFDHALVLERYEADAEMKKLDRPEEFELVPVVISVSI